MNETNLPATTEAGGAPAWYFGGDDEAEGAVDRYGGATAGEGGGLPFLGFAAKDTGSRGGSVTWADLRDAGCAENDLYAFGGVLSRPVRLANVPLLLVEAQRVAYSVDETEGFRAVGARAITSHLDAQPGEIEAWDALILVLAEPTAFLGTYRDRLNKGKAIFSRVVAPWADRLRAAKPPAGLPRWAAACGRLRAESDTSRTSGRTYRKQVLQLGELTAAELARLAAWMRSDEGGLASGPVVERWRHRLDETADGGGPEAGVPAADPTEGWK